MNEVALVAPASARVNDTATTRARMLMVAGSALWLIALVLLVMLLAADPSGADTDDRRRIVVHLLAAAPLIPLGALLLARAPGHPIGVLVAVTALGQAAVSAGNAYATYSHFVHSLPAAQWIGWCAEWMGATILLVPTVALMLFPDGHLPSRRWRPALWCGIGATVLVGLSGMFGPGDDLSFQGNPFLSDQTAKGLGDLFSFGWALMIPAIVMGIRAIVIRRRSAVGEQREQLRLLERGALVVGIAFLGCLIANVVAPDAVDFAGSAAVLSLTFLAATMAVAILRHRLYGVDVYVNRALVLSALSVVLGAVYVVAVVAVSHLLDTDVELGVALPATILVALAFQPVRGWLQRRVNRLLYGHRDEPYAAISTLGRRLGEAVAPADVLPVMVETIADTLRLPYVAVELASGPAVVHGAAAAGVALRLPLVHAGDDVGTLLIGARTHGEPLSENDRRLLEDFAARASSAASAVALSVEVQHSRQRLVTAREEERRRLRGDLHDGLGPTLAGAVLTIEAAQRVLAKDPEAANALLEQAAASVEGTVSEVRRVVYALRPPALDELGLTGALRQQAAALSNGSGDLECEVHAPAPMPALPAAVEVATFRIAQEAMTNVARHANARHASVSITIDETLQLDVDDDGSGIPAAYRAGVGLTSMRERATELGGSVAITAPPSGGTRIHVELPLPPTQSVRRQPRTGA
jgi:two-component system, NarL family, sensor kinase